MPLTFYMPTRVVHGADAMAQLAALCRELRIARPLVVTDPAIAALPFCREALQGLADAGIEFARFDGCGIDARLRHVDMLAQQSRSDRRDGVIAIGGGSVMCTGKGVAITAPNSESFRNHVGYAAFANKALPQIMVPTTAGSGAEVSQYTLIKDEERHAKLVGGGPMSFPDAAILDPMVLESLPRRIAAVAAIDALTHAIEAVFTTLATPLTDAIALAAVRLQLQSLPGSLSRREEASRHDNLLAAAMANIACGSARLGLAHSLSIPLEGGLDVNHGIGVGVLMPRVVEFNSAAAPEGMRAMVEAFGIRTRARGGKSLGRAVAERLFEIYDEFGFPRYFDPAAVPPGRMAEMARTAVKGLWGGGPQGKIGDATIIESPNIRPATVRQARRIYEACFA